VFGRKKNRVPWKRSTEPRDCGAAAFACIASYFGHHLSVEESRELVRTDRTGTSMRWICEGSRSIGLEARGARSDYDSLQHVPTPALVHLDDEDGHYMVLTRWTPKRVFLIDPSVGPMQMSRSNFEDQWSSLLVEFIPSPVLQPKQPTFSAADEIVRGLRRSPSSILLSILMLTAATGLALLIAGQLAQTIDAAIGGDDGSLTRLAVLLIGSAIVVAGSQVLRIWLMARVGEQVENDLADRFLDSVGYSKTRDFEERCPVAFAGRIGETTGVQTMITETFSSFASDLLVVALSLAVLLSIHPVLAFIALTAVPIFGLIAAYGQRFGRIVVFDELRKDYAFLTRLVDTFSEFHTVKIYNAEDRAVGDLYRRFAAVTAARRKGRMINAAPAIISGLVVSLATVAVVVGTGALTSRGLLSPGEAILTFGAAGVCFGAMQRVPGLVVMWRNALLNLERLQEIIHKEPEPGTGLEHHALAGIGHVRFKSVDFHYSPEQPVLDGLDFEIRGGETVALVGATGSGKTSIARLLSMFELPDSGLIELDGVNVNRLNPAQVREAVTVVFQDTRLLQLSIRDNLLLGNQDATHEQLTQALEMACVDDVVAAQRLGLETHAARAGRNLSSGQGQRLALARALLRDPAVLVLDEATANVDSQIESKALQQVLQMRAGRTTILTAHRLATVIMADRVLVLEDGKVVQDGSPQALSQIDGPFLRLFEAQMIRQPAAQ